jgi:hypothetical protein
MKRADVRCLAVSLGAMVLIATPSAHAGCSEATGFPHPGIIRSSDGVLETVLRARVATNEVTDQLTGETRLIHTPTYAGTFPDPRWS